MRYLEESKSQNLKAEWWLLGARKGGFGSHRANGTEFQFYKMKRATVVGGHTL